MAQINSLVELAQAIEAGEEFETKNVQGSWVNYTKYDDPTEVSLVDSFVCGIPLRIKPQTKVIDMPPFIENGLDVCFGDRPDQCYFIGSLKAIHKSEQLVDLYQDQTNSEWKFCQPRLNHPFIWTPDIELPEGLDVEYCWDRIINCKPVWRDHNPFGSRSDLLIVARITGCKEGYKFPDGEE